MTRREIVLAAIDEFLEYGNGIESNTVKPVSYYWAQVGSRDGPLFLDKHTLGDRSTDYF